MFELTPEEKQVAANLKKIRGGRTLEAVALAANMKHQSLHNYETGRNRITIGKLVQLVRALGVPLDKVFEEVDLSGK